MFLLYQSRVRHLEHSQRNEQKNTCIYFVISNSSSVWWTRDLNESFIADAWNHVPLVVYMSVVQSLSFVLRHGSYEPILHARASVIAALNSSCCSPRPILMFNPQQLMLQPSTADAIILNSLCYNPQQLKLLPSTADIAALNSWCCRPQQLMLQSSTADVAALNSWCFSPQ